MAGISGRIFALLVICLVFAGFGGQTQSPGDARIAVSSAAAPLSFAAATTWTTGVAPAVLAAGDFNRDGKLDLATADYGPYTGGASILLGNGAGGFGSPNILRFGVTPRAIAAADLNGDGKLDLVIGDYDSGTLNVYLGNGSGGFTNTGSYSVPVWGPFAIGIADLNGDGKLDLASANFLGQNVTAFLGNGSGSFGAAHSFTAGTQPFDLAAADFNGDGKMDLVVTNPGSNNISLLLGDGSGGFATAKNFALGIAAGALAVADFNGDGKPDVAVSTASGILVLLGDGAGGFSSPSSFPLAGGGGRIAVADLDGDGKLDLVVAGGAASVAVLLGNGDGTFGSPSTFSLPAVPGGVVVGDFNGDGRPDIAATLGTLNQVAILLNTTSTATCSYTIATASAQTSAGGGSGSVSVTAPGGCAWTAVSNANWITISSGSSGSGNGTVTYTVAPNASTVARTGTLAITGQTFTVTQAAAACTFAISPASASVSAMGGTGIATVTAPSGCPWTASSNASWITITSGSSGSGNGSVGYSVAVNTGSTMRSGTLTIAGQTFTVSQAMATGPMLFAGGVVNGASFAQAPAPVAPGSLVSIFGLQLAGGVTVAASLPLPTTLNGTQVLMNGVAAPLIFVSPGQINAQVPWEISGSSINTQVVFSGASSNTVAVAGGLAPAVFTMNQSGSGQGAILSAADGSLAAVSGTVTGRLARPVMPGEYISLYCTGLGAVSNPPSSGAAAPSEQLSTTTSAPTVTIGGIPATVVFSGLAPGFVGLYQVNVQIPANVPAGDALPVVLSISGGTSRTVTLASMGGSASSAVSTADANGLATVSSGAVSIPVLLTDPLTGNPIQGVNVSLGLPASQKGLATLFVTDPQGRYPDQFLNMTAPRTAGAAAVGGEFTRMALAGTYAATPTPAPVQSGCPSTLPGNVTVQPSIDSINVPGPPPASLLDAMRDAELSALSNFAAKYGLKISFRDRQLGFASGSDCAQQIWDWVRPEAVDAAKFSLALKALEYGSGAELTLWPVDILHSIANADVAAMSAALKVCQSWVKGATVRAIDLGNQRLLSAVLSGQPTPSNVVSQTVTTQNSQGQPAPSSLCYVSAGTLAGDFAGNTDATGKTVMNIPPDSYTVDITAPGYKTATQNLTLPPGTQPPPLAVNLASTTPQGSFTLTVTKSGDGSGSVTGGGIVCGSTCSASYAAGTVVTLTATPLTGSTFTGWSGACSGTASCSVTMDANKAVTATFTTAPAPGGPLVFTAPATLPPATVGVTYTYNFCTPAPATPTSACGPMPPTTNPTGGNPPYHFQLGSGAGFPPMGISLGKDGQLTGTPQTPGTSTFQVCAIDLSANSVCQTVSLTVSASVTGTYTAHVAATVGSNSPICGHGQTTVSVDFQLTITGGQGTSGSPFTGSFSGRGTEADFFGNGSVCTGTYPFNVLSATVGGSSGQIAVAGMAGMSLGTDHQSL